MVFLSYSQEELDRAYNQRAYAVNQEQVELRLKARSQEARQRLGMPWRLSYGESTAERLDIFESHDAPAPTVVYVHGGAWRGGSAENSAFPAEVLIDADVNYVALDFSLVDDAGGSLYPMVEQVRKAVAWVYHNTASFGGDPGRIHLVGHSSGAHLAACVLSTDWQANFGLPSDVIKTGLLASGMYDLYPVSLSARSQYVSFTSGMIEDLSPIRRVESWKVPVIVAYGTLETPEFQRQSQEFADALGRAGKDVKLLVGEGYNHFEIRETLGNPYGLLGRAVLEQVCRID